MLLSTTKTNLEKWRSVLREGTPDDPQSMYEELVKVWSGIGSDLPPETLDRHKSELERAIIEGIANRAAEGHLAEALWLLEKGFIDLPGIPSN